MEASISLSELSWLQRLARAQVFKVLSQVEGGGLTLKEQGQEFFFGDSNSDLQADIRVNKPEFYTRILFGGSIAAAESWVDQDWESDTLTQVIQVFARCLPVIEKLEQRFAWLRMPAEMIGRFVRRNTKEGSRTNIAAHYDLGNDMYRLFLDPYMQYSSAIFPSSASTLSEAQEYKMWKICEALELGPEDHLLEIGTGWGGLACYAAKHYGCRVTTTTLSGEQFKLAQQRALDMGVSDKVEFLLKDYRDLEGQFDKLVSIEMIEAVGHEFLGQYFSALNNLLKPGGKLLIQAITIADQRYEAYRRSTDFINRYIFPGGCLPSVSVMMEQLRAQTRFNLDSIQSYGLDYARTLEVWEQRFNENHSALNSLGYSDDFQRLWQFYFAYCQAGFLEETINLIHFQASKQR
ncbi:class I SAM-dependent methyltransferase [Spongiibacter sp. KMU-158]|uniref:Class I SAM-dependent methyltransferase n=1 Tax=Spongiibacter pelagi TaxID=2760804 RepID=A0A927C0W5_9GAMM|nr:cyclopropane-fatty-acyl-phospholipid synthase family protein [Spongiibacter pelagi]MBD2859200.1 class I SAM-dependent methyltransferase [Spongiibacter pelagi]